MDSQERFELRWATLQNYLTPLKELQNPALLLSTCTKSQISIPWGPEACKPVHIPLFSIAAITDYQNLVALNTVSVGQKSDTPWLILHSGSHWLKPRYLLSVLFQAHWLLAGLISFSRFPWGPSIFKPVMASLVLPI